MKDNINVEIIKADKTPLFCNYIFKAIPLAFDESMSYYECLCGLLNYLKNTIMPTLNNNAEALAELQKLFTKLQDYVNNYFDNLDVQDEINNKLDQMVEDGTLAAIISNYIDKHMLRVYNNIDDMIKADLSENIKVKTLGYYEINDGGEGNYLIRTKNQDDVEDKGLIHFVGNDLVAELIVEDNVNVKQFGVKGDGTHDDTQKLQSAIDSSANSDFSLFIPNGTYLISQLITLQKSKIIGENENLTILKSINNNDKQSLLMMLNINGKFNVIKNLTIDGNKENNNSLIDGIHFLGNSYIGDCETTFENINIKNCSNNGMHIEGSNIIGANFININISYSNAYGLMVSNSTDCSFINCKSYFNKKSGVYISGSNHRILNCKTNTNGRGDEVTIDLLRTPASAYSPTSDTVVNPNKSYYTRSGSPYDDDPYLFTKFNGSSFVSGITYYELLRFYYKRYAGYEIYSRRSVISNCEAQDNFGDGLYLQANNVSIENFNGDGNGYLCVRNGEINDRLSYNEAGLEQIYDGIHAHNCNSNNINGSFANHRYTSELGAFQRTGLCLDSCNYTNAQVTSTNQKTNKPIVLTQLSNLNIITNGKEYEEDYDLSRLKILTENFYIRNNNDANQSYLKRVNNKVSMKLIIKNENGTGTSLNTDIPITTLPQRFRPTKILHPLISFSKVDGYLIQNDKISNANIYSTDGKIAIRGFTDNTNTSVILECEYFV